MALSPTQSQSQTVPNATFISCDGYGHPGGAGDGITRDPAIWGIIPGLPAVGEREDISLTMGRVGLDACNAALADARMSPNMWMRKVSLLRARALHHLALNDPAGALADLDLAQAAAVGHTDAYYDRSLGLGLDLVRAYALRMKGDAAAADALTITTWKRRPYNIQVSLAALLSLGVKGDPADIESVNRGLASVAPRWLDTLFQQMFERGRFKDVIAIYPQLVPTTQRETAAYGQNLLEIHEANRMKTEVFWLLRGGQAAYALAALGQADQARTVLDKTQARVNTATEPLPPPDPNPDGTPGKPNKIVAVILKNDAALARAAPTAMAYFGRMVDLRNRLAQGKVDEVAAAVLAPSFAPGPFGADLVAATIADLTPATAGLKPKLAVLEARLLALRRPPTEATPAALFKALPDAESPIKVASYRKVGPLGGFLTGGDNGYRVTVDAQQVSHLTFRGHLSSRTIIEEMALLSAIDCARAAGARGIVLLDSQDVEHVINHTYYGTVMSTQADGYETDLTFIYADPAAPPVELSQAPWRILSVDTVYAALSPFYIRSAK